MHTSSTAFEQIQYQKQWNSNSVVAALNSSHLHAYFWKLYFFIVTKNELLMHKYALEEEFNILTDKNTALFEEMYIHHKNVFNFIWC